MHCSLDNHSRGYNISLKDGLFSVVTGLSGAPYAYRHWQLSQQSKSWGHRAVAVLEAIPVLGALAALLERIVVIAYKFFNKPPSNHTSPPLKDQVKKIDASDNKISQVFAKMWKNSNKAVLEHQKKEADIYIGTSPIHSTTTLPSLGFTFTAAEDQGHRPTMEDAHFFAQIPQGILTGVFDGHGGDQVSKFASEQFQKKFSQALTVSNDNVRQTFESVINEIHEEVIKKKEWNQMGSTAVVCFVDQKTNLIYTATLGDSEANIYRKMEDGQVKSIPLSCVRDWSSKRDAQRAALALNDPKIAEQWPNAKNQKKLRFPNQFFGINVSRAIGDAAFAIFNDKAGVSHKPKITLNQLQPGDTLVLACDGLKDFVTEKEIISFNAQANLAQKLVDYAIKQKHSSDNVTVLAVEVK